MYKQDIILNFKEELSIEEEGKHVRDGLSAALRTGNNLWICCDERSTIERLTLMADGSFGNHKSFDLSNYINLPSGKGSKVDIEGLALEGNKYLWVVGSHSLARKKPRKKDSPEEQIRRLSRIKEDLNRNILARIPIWKNPETGNYELRKSSRNSEEESETLTAAQLRINEKGNQLTEALSLDEHFKHFMKIPGKDNGFDIEGLAVKDGRVFLGVRGPVLRGWAIILETEVEDMEGGYFQLKKGKKGNLYKKHFLNLEGMGIRDLVILDDDLLILAGPTMDLDGTIAVYRWPEGTQQNSETIVHRKELNRLFDVPHGFGETSGQDKAEGMALYDDRHVLIVFDSPSDARKPLDSIVIADLFKLSD